MSTDDYLDADMAIIEVVHEAWGERAAMSVARLLTGEIHD